MILLDFTGFDCDAGNSAKNYKSHRVSDIECEEVFFNAPLVIPYDIIHSGLEKRYYVLGRTDKGRMLFVAFAYRAEKIRVISARDMSKKERRSYSVYYKEEKDTKI